MRISPPRLAALGVASVLAASLAVVASSAARTGAAPATPAAAAALGAQLDTILADQRESGSQVGLTVRDADTGATLYARNGDPRLDGATAGLTVRDLDTGATLYDASGATRVLPASNAKLLTSAAALDVLGPGFRFATSVLRTGRVAGHTLTGNLYLQGHGDPMITAAGYDTLAAAVAKAGIRRVDGSLVADDTAFDDVRLAPFWSWDDEPYYYSAQTSALNISPDDIGDTGTVLVDVTPATHVGGRPRITMTPANTYLRIRNTATTGASGSAQTVDATREYGRNVLDVTGSIPLGAAAYASQPTVDQPTGLVAQVFARALARHGVLVTHRHTSFGATPHGAAAVTTTRSAPLSQVLTPFLKLSNNMIAEALTKAMGVRTAGQGTWAAGTSAILTAVAKDGVDPDVLALYDGSGLGRADYVTTNQVTALLDGVRTKPWFPTWYAALPIAGESDQLVGGTLRNRMTGTAAAGNVHAKTGSETGVSALSGYVTDAAGAHLTFSMISNNFVQGGITTLEDAVAETLADYGGPNAAVQPALAPLQRGTVTDDRRAQLECSWTRSC